jgi:diguanylate cyclase (GGDEF)-like protein/PAS domain S-box-containing protein
MSYPSDSADAPEPASSLRQRAETRLRTFDLAELDTLTPEMGERLVHELRIHQIELELQNEELRRTQEAMEVVQARYFDLYDLAPVGYLTLSEAGLIKEANLLAATLLKIPRDKLIDQPLNRFIHPEDQDLYYRCRNRLWSLGAQQTVELRLQQVDGPPLWVQLETMLEPKATSDQPLWRIVLFDISLRKNVEYEHHEAHALLSLVAKIADLTFWKWNPNTKEACFPLSWQQQTGYVSHESPLHLADWLELLHPEDRERIFGCLTRFAAVQTPSCEIQYRLRHQNGGYRWYVSLLEPFQDDQGTLTSVLLVQQDVTRRKEAEDQALYLAQQDPLTGLPSRALFNQLAKHMLATAHRAGSQLALLFMDLDHFKAVNDTYGHPVGDRLLQAVARRLRDAFRAEDLVARLGGDEFLAVLANIHDTNDAASAARTAIAALAPTYLIDGFELQCAPSVGISLYPQDGNTIDHLIQCADVAMYRAKKTSPGQYQFATDQEQSVGTDQGKDYDSCSGGEGGVATMHRAAGLTLVMWATVQTAQNSFNIFMG